MVRNRRYNRNTRALKHYLKTGKFIAGYVSYVIFEKTGELKDVRYYIIDVRTNKIRQVTQSQYIKTMYVPGKIFGKWEIKTD